MSKSTGTPPTVKPTRKRPRWGYVRNWEEFQHYTGRNNTWLKLYPRILRDPAFAALSDAARFHVLGIFMLALETDNHFMLDADYLRGVLNTTEPVDVGLLLRAGFIASGSASNKRLDKTRPDKKRLDTPRAIYAAADEVGFSTWWNRYPRRVDKVKAARAWLRLTPDDQSDAAGPGLVGWLQYWQSRNEPQFVPYPATWLNNRRWEAEPPKARGRGNRSGRNYDE